MPTSKISADLAATLTPTTIFPVVTPGVPNRNQITTTAALSAALSSGGVSPITGATLPASATYTPTFVLSSGAIYVASSIIPWRYLVLGDLYLLFGQATVQTSGSGTLLMKLGLPFSGTFNGQTTPTVSGGGSSTTTNSQAGIYADVGAGLNYVFAEFYATAAGSQTYTIVVVAQKA